MKSKKNTQGQQILLLERTIYDKSCRRSRYYFHHHQAIRTLLSFSVSEPRLGYPEVQSKQPSWTAFEIHRFGFPILCWMLYSAIPFSLSLKPLARKSRISSLVYTALCSIYCTAMIPVSIATHWFSFLRTCIRLPPFTPINGLRLSACRPRSY